MATRPHAVWLPQLEVPPGIEKYLEFPEEMCEVDYAADLVYEFDAPVL